MKNFDTGMIQLSIAALIGIFTVWTLLTTPNMGAAIAGIVIGLVSTILLALRGIASLKGTSKRYLPPKIFFITALIGIGIALIIWIVIQLRNIEYTQGISSTVTIIGAVTFISLYAGIFMLHPSEQRK